MQTNVSSFFLYSFTCFFLLHCSILPQGHCCVIFSKNSKQYYYNQMAKGKTISVQFVFHRYFFFVALEKKAWLDCCLKGICKSESNRFLLWNLAAIFDTILSLIIEKTVQVLTAAHFSLLPSNDTIHVRRLSEYQMKAASTVLKSNDGAKRSVKQGNYNTGKYCISSTFELFKNINHFRCIFPCSCFTTLVC